MSNRVSHVEDRDSGGSSFPRAAEEALQEVEAAERAETAMPVRSERSANLSSTCSNTSTRAYASSSWEAEKVS
jgi:hypothetical protein